MTDEYAIDAVCLREALPEQRAMKLTGGLYHLNQVVLAYNSNRIEGSLLSAEQTRYICETHSVNGEARVDDVIATTGSHFTDSVSPSLWNSTVAPTGEYQAVPQLIPVSTIRAPASVDVTTVLAGLNCE